MAAGNEVRKTELLERVSALIDKRMAPGKAKPAKIFATHYFRNVAPVDIANREAEDLYGAAMSMWTFGQQRKPGTHAIRVFNPRFEQHGWHASHTVIEIVNDDMPFLVDSVAAELSRQGLTVHLIVHPVFGVTRDDKGKAIDFPSDDADPKSMAQESFMHVEIDEQGSADALKAVEAGLSTVLDDCRASVEDWPGMRSMVKEVSKELRGLKLGKDSADAQKETAALLDWMYDDHFTFLGYRSITYSGKGKAAKLKIDDGSGMGILRDPDRSVFEGLRNLGKLPPEVQAHMHDPAPVRILKANIRATVHRRVHMDTVAVKRYDKDGAPIGEHLFVGLLTSVAYNQSPREIPFLRKKVDAVMARSGFLPSGHNGKALSHTLESYPRDELFQIAEETLFEIAMGILHLQDRQRIAVFVRPDVFQRFVSILTFVPRDRFSTSLRQRIGEALAKAYEGHVAAHYTMMSDEALSRVQFIIKTTPGKLPVHARDELEARLADIARSWGDKLRQALVESLGEEKGIRLHRRYVGAFSAAYQEEQDVQTSVFDIQRVEEARSDGEIRVNLYQPLEAESNEMRFKIYHPGVHMVLSSVMPMIENMGIQVLDEQLYEVRPDGGDDRVFIHDFGMRTADGGAIDLDGVRTVFHESFARAWKGEIEDDGFNRLVLRAGLGWRDVVVLRAYSKYLRQAAIPFSQDYMEETLANNAEITRRLAALFTLRFDPAADGDQASENALVAEINEMLDAVSNLDEDRMIRRFLNLIQCTLRTNYFQPAADGGHKSYVSFKFESRSLLDLPPPAPLREIFVYSPRFEAVHLRFGFVARGGLRWSDRREDFRTEILGLVKAQQVKNAVIVPVGSKGGFVLKRPPPASDRKAFQEEGIACYKLFISGMLDITDNLDGSDVVPPKSVVRKDADDPYLVVAADKGTATFSDYSNGVSQAYGFWLDDAFASGGSAGYDHKKMGITARGAWEAVKRHFREMNHDTQTQDFTVIGVGDMGGDVFGNGMLLSEHIQLLAAFNHLHIFIDPTPDAAASFKERKRLFDEVAGWDQYDTKLISKGGGVFNRSEKSIKLTPEIKACFSIPEDALSPIDLINRILKSEADLLWFGGIGTYVKHSQESNADAGDRANDPLRVDARDLKVKVIGEGANLGMTHRARIEFAQNGGHVNSDAIDNSAGVDCSDHEVNIKILLGDVVRGGDMTEKQRNAVLEEMTDEVASLVLRDNYQQTQSISVSERRAAEYIDDHQRVIRAMERAGELNRALEFLPDDETIAERMQAQKGLVRPELSVVFAYAKNLTYQALLESDLPDDPTLEEDLIRYFPELIRQRFPDKIATHRLRREIIATAVTNSMINRTGPAFVDEMRRRTGRDAADIARAYTIVREVFGLRDIWNRIEGLDNVAQSDCQYAMLTETVRTIERMTEWFLRNGTHPLDIRANVEVYREGIEILRGKLDEVLGEMGLTDVEKRRHRFLTEGVPKDLAVSIAQLKVLSSGCDVVKLAQATDKPVDAVGRTYSSVGARFGLDWLRSAANRIPSDNQWHRMALSAIIDDLWGLQSEYTARILDRYGAEPDAIAKWIAHKGESADRVEGLLSELRNLPQLDLAMLAVVSRELRSMVAT